MQKAADPNDFSVLVAVDGGHVDLALHLIKHGANVNFVQVHPPLRSLPWPPCLSVLTVHSSQKTQPATHYHPS